MSKVKIRSLNKVVDITPASFGKKIAKVMNDLASSHVFFIVQQAYGDIDYTDVQKIFEEVLKSNGIGKVKN